MSITAGARANGRFPRAQAIMSVPGSDGTTLFLRATFGVLISRDSGKTWRWICERALGYEGQWDPATAVTRDGRLWVALERSLVVTSDGCTVETEHALDGETVRDLTTDPEGRVLWAVTGAPEKRGAVWKKVVVKEGSDGGSGAWEKAGLLPEDVYPSTIEVSPSKPSRLYVTGQPYATLRGALYRSDDGGRTTVADVGGKNDLAADGPLFLAWIDPKDPNRAVMRHLHGAGSDVLLTTDGGKTLKNVLSIKSAMYGFAKSPDGKTLWAGSGIPQDGIYRSIDRGEHFERIASHGVLCLHAGPKDRLVICENPFTPGGATVSVSADQGKTIDNIATYADILGPPACSEDAGAALCGGAWPEMQAQLLPREAGAPDPSGPDGGRRRRKDAGAPPAASAGGDGRAPDARRSACGCRVVGAPTAPDLVWLTAGLVPLVVWGRARRGRGSRPVRRGESSTT